MKCILSIFGLLLFTGAYNASATETVCGKIKYASDVIFEIEREPVDLYNPRLIVRLDAKQISSSQTLSEARADIESAMRLPEYYQVCVEVLITGYPKSNVFLYKTIFRRIEKRRLSPEISG